MLGSTLALLSAAASAFAVVVVGKHSRKSNAFNVSLIISCVGITVLWPLAVLLTDITTANLEGLALFAIGGVLAPGLVRLFYYGGLKKLGAPVNSSLFSVYPLYSALLAVLLLSEILSWENWGGIFCIILGGFFVEMSSHEINGTRKSARKSLLFPIVGGVTLGVSAIIRKAALNFFDAPVLGIAIGYTFSLLTYALILAFSASTRKELSLKQDFRFYWKAGIGQALSWILTFYALSYEQVSIVTPILAVEPLFVAFFAYLYLRELERVSLKLVASTILIVLGVALVII
jgi:DME family drug/metabolite transporter